CKVTGKCGSVSVRLIPAPRGTGIVSAPVPKKLLTMAGIEDCYTSARGSTCTLEWADAAPARGGFRGGFGSRGGRGGRGRGRGRSVVVVVVVARRLQGMGSSPNGSWFVMAKSTHWKKSTCIALPIKEFEIIDFFLGSALRDEVLKIMPVQNNKLVRGQRSPFQGFRCSSVTTNRSHWFGCQVQQGSCYALFVVPLSC
ncbi:hypothetical protein DOY81_014892, partial [Sarcophaga bullata]